MAIRLFDVIMADVPSNYETWSEKGNGRGAIQHYETMDFDDICALPVANLAAERSVLFMWGSWPFLEHIVTIIHEWGFEYKTNAFVWIKTNPEGVGIFLGQGKYTRKNSEFCLLATRGDPLPVANHDVSEIIMSPVREHSRKPEEQYAKIERLYPGMRYIELFARERHPGWKTWGKEAPDGLWKF